MEAYGEWEGTNRLTCSHCPPLAACRLDSRSDAGEDSNSEDPKTTSSLPGEIRA